MEYLSIKSFHWALTQGVDAYTLIRHYLDRIDRFDQKGPTINAIISQNTKWEKDLSTILKEVDPSAPLYAVPVLVKDNIDVKGMPTTAGSLSLKDNVAQEDAKIVARIRSAGGLLLAKTNLHEFAVWGETLSSMTGQTKNPYDLTRTPGGSSGGTGAGLAMDYGIVGLGTDTINSVRSPSSANNLVGLRPSAGVLSDEGIIPYSKTQDSAGPMARNINDLTALYRVLADDWREVTIPKCPRIGVLRSFFGEDPDIQQVMDQVLQRIGSSVELIALEEAFDNQYLIDHVSVHLFDLQNDLNEYLGRRKDGQIRSLSDILASGQYHPGIRENLEMAAKLTNRGPEYHARRKEAKEWADRLFKLYETYDLHALIYPHQQQLVCKIGQSQLGRNGVLASITGFCSLALPAGFSRITEEAPLGVPIGYELLARPGEDLKLLALGNRLFEDKPFVSPSIG